MKRHEPHCPKCQQPLATSRYCWRCKSLLEFGPDFLSTLPGKALFVSGAVLLGSSLSETLSALGYQELGIDRLMIDVGLGIGYYFICRFVFSLFQHRTVVQTQHRGDSENRS
jgi:hypothetical protein